MDCPWLHCNICTRLPYPSGCKFFFANCGHIACAKCVGRKLLSPRCIKCKRETTKVTEITDKMDESARKYFQNIGSECENICRSVKKAVEFQMKNVSRLINYKRTRIRELSRNAAKDSNARKLIMQLQREKERLESENKTLLQQSETLNQSRMNTTRMLLAGNGFMNMSGSSFLIAQETPNAFLHGNGTIQQNKNELTSNGNDGSRYPFSFNYDIDQPSCCNTVPRVEKKSFLDSESTQIPVAENGTPAKKYKNEINEAKKDENDQESLRRSTFPIVEEADAHKREEKNQECRISKETPIPRSRKPTVHRSSL